MASPVAVLDSSVLVPSWSRFVLQRLAAASPPRHRPVWSEWIVAETWRVLTWRWATRSSRLHPTEWRQLTRSANQMLSLLIPVMTLVSLRDYTGQAPWPGLQDADDAPIWKTAVVAGAQYVVSQNVADFPPLEHGWHVYQGIEYLTAIEYIEAILDEDATVVLGTPLPLGASIRSHRAR